MIKIEIEGTEFPLPPEIAAKDELLKAALTPFVPWIANAQIERQEKDGTMVVKVVKRADWKGNTLRVSAVEGRARAVVDALIGSPDEMNPAVALWLEIQDQADLNDPGVVLALEPRISQAIDRGEQDIAAVHQSLTRLVECASTSATRIPLGF
jgi:hypothetical protein